MGLPPRGAAAEETALGMPREKSRGGAFPLENLTNSRLGALGLYVAIVIAYLLAA